MSKSKKILKYLFLLLVGGFSYILIELLWRGRSHPTMIVVGGLCFVLCGLLNEVTSWETPLPQQMLLSAVLISIIEFIAGCIINIILGLNVWNYSDMKYNIMGQVCMEYTFLWFLLSCPAIILDDYIRYWKFGEEKPRYVLFTKKK